jgi:hypothetical protein
MEQTEVFAKEGLCSYNYQTITHGLGFAFSNECSAQEDTAF